ncbi:type II secretion system protein GspL [Photobacterium kishitanii]|uniref:Type II secretion system protein L n=1 Tax=Photobacterium kishitanii TaxID=318456 RepID=A0A2T3KA88_9GAMM|nr:type II secretion system protein GspL [Photobacterium kishitanii]
MEESVSEFLTIRLSSRPGMPVQWLVWSPLQNEVIASGQLADINQLSELTEYAVTRPVYGLVPTSEMLLTQVAIPAGSSRQLTAVLPYLLEEELAQDVDSLHVQLLKRDNDIATVAIIEHQKIALWLAAFADCGIELKKLIPDCLCLPLFSDGYSAAEIDGQWLIRQSEAMGVCADASWLAAWVTAQKAPIVIDRVDDTADDDGDEIESDVEADRLAEEVESIVAATESLAQVTIHHYTPAPVNIPGHWQPQAPELVMQLLAIGAAESKATLLSGPYKPQAAWRKHLQPWRKVAIAAAVVLVALIGEQVLTTQRLEQQANAYRAESERIFRQVLPQFKRIPSQSYLKNQMNAALKSLGGHGEQNGMLMWLSELKPALTQVPTIKIVNLKYDQTRGELRLQATAAGFQDFEQLRSALSAQFEVDQGQLTKADNLVSGAVVLRRKA